MNLNIDDHLFGLWRKLRREANLLVTFDSMNYGEARAEVIDALREVGESHPVFLHSAVGGVFMVKVDMDPKETVRKLNDLCRADPLRFQYTYHWIPIERWCPSTIEEMSRVIREFAERIKPDESWRMEIHKRFYKAFHTNELIEKLAQHVDRPKVDLKNPQKTIRIEIIAREAGLSLLGPKEHLSVNKVKAEALTKAEHH